MLWLKVLAIGLASGAGLLQIGLDYRWHDKRTRRNRNIRRTLIVVMVAGALVAAGLVVSDDRESAARIATLTALKKSAEVAAKEAATRELEAKQDRAQLKTKIEDLQSSIEPFLVLAAANYPELDPRAALSRLAEEVQGLRQTTKALENQTRALSARDFFRPLDSQIRLSVVAQLRGLAQQFSGRTLSVSVSVETGHTGRQKVARELVEILQASGFQAKGPIATQTFSRGVLPPVRIMLNPIDEGVAQALATALHPFLRVQFVGKKKEKREPSDIEIAIYGEPLFDEAGVVTFP